MLVPTWQLAERYPASYHRNLLWRRLSQLYGRRLYPGVHRGSGDLLQGTSQWAIRSYLVLDRQLYDRSTLSRLYRHHLLGDRILARQSLANRSRILDIRRLPLPRPTSCRIAGSPRLVHRAQLCPLTGAGRFRKRFMDVRERFPRSRNGIEHLLAKLGYQDRLPELGLSSHDVERIPRSRLPVCSVW